MYLSPQLVLGKQYTNKEGSPRHFQAEITPWLLGDRSEAFPTAVISYGISF